jgi:hypothetical protein
MSCHCVVLLKGGENSGPTGMVTFHIRTSQLTSTLVATIIGGVFSLVKLEALYHPPQLVSSRSFLHAYRAASNSLNDTSFIAIQEVELQSKCADKAELRCRNATLHSAVEYFA